MFDRLRRDERGAVMVMAALALTVLLLFAGLALDFGRAHLLRAQLQTAVDAASLAGALQGVVMTEIEVSRWVHDTYDCPDPITGQLFTCDTWKSVSPARATGSYTALISHGGWQDAVADQCDGGYRCSGSYRQVREPWIILPADGSPDTVARNTFYQNALWPGGSGGIRIRGVQVETDRNKVEVTTTATIDMPTTFLKLAAIDHITISRTGSAVPIRR